MITNFIKFILSNFALTLLVVGIIATLISLINKPKPLNQKIVFKALLSYFVLFSIGISYVYNFYCHVFLAKTVAKYIGWANNPFQYEVGYASLGFGIVGLIAFRANFSWKAASIIGPAFFWLGAAGGHLYQMITAHNFAPGNAGIIFYTDIFLPIIGLYLLYKHYKLSKS